MRFASIAFLAIAAVLIAPVFSQEPSVRPKLLLTASRLHRLQRDRERKTIRWVNFERRVQSVPDSSQRGFELALHYVVTEDPARGQEAIAWALAHADLCEERQVALVLDWCGPLLTESQRVKLSKAGCNVQQLRDEIRTLQDEVFLKIASAKDDWQIPDSIWAPTVASFRKGNFHDHGQVYALCELIDAVRASRKIDLRINDAEFFGHLPAEYLLSMKPGVAAHPPWQARAAALILVTIDPNLTDAQFLQGWAIEDQQMMVEGEGVAYELLWGNPYLPGVSYQNLDPWLYDSGGRLFARNDWSSDACWISIGPNGAEDQHCPADWRQRTAQFGHLTLQPMTTQCASVPHDLPNGSAFILWNLKPEQRVSYRVTNKPEILTADRSGMLRLPLATEGKVCPLSR